MMITNIELRQRMRKVIKPNLQVLLVISLIVALPQLLGEVIVSVSGSELIAYLNDHGILTSSTVEQIMEVTQAYVAERGWVLVLTWLFQALMTPVLMLGLINATLTLLRGGTAVITTAFSRLRAFGRSVLLTQLVGLKIFLWALPGAAVMTLSGFLGDGGFAAGTVLGSLLMLVLLTMAVYRYALSNFFLADEPQTGVRACIRQSKAVMKNRKMQLFTLDVPYLMGNWAVSVIADSLLPGALGLAVGVLAELVFAVYICGAHCAFFEAYTRPDGGRAHAFQSDPYHNEMKE